jgi:chaperonin cofactor prefoldin
MSVIAEIIDTLENKIEKLIIKIRRLDKKQSRFTNRINKICRHHTNSVK